MFKWSIFVLFLHVIAMNAAASERPELASAVFAGGCFWCMEPPFDKLDGVIATTSGYTGGDAEDAVYPLVSAGKTAHFEAIKVDYDPAKVDYATLLDVFWHNIDPFNDRGQFCDRGAQYRSAVFFKNDAEKKAALLSIKDLQKKYDFTRPFVTQVLPASDFYPAEDYHQDYYKKNPIRYRYYRTGCGRDRRLFDIWGAEKQS